jgi:glycosyltransferase involved in cell wall biosynthesis
VENGKSSGLHVLTLTPFFPSVGDEVSGCFIAESLRYLAAQGVASSVIAVDSIYHRRREPSPQYPAQWVRYPQLPGNFGLSSAGGFLGAALLPKIKKLHERSPISLIHAHAALPCGHAAAFLSRHLKIPFVVTVHGLDVFNRCFEDGIAARWRRKASTDVYKSASKIICISQKVKRVLEDGPDKNIQAEVVYNGTDTELFSPEPAQETRPTILVIGTLLAGKGHELVLRAVAQLKDAHPALQCEIMGEGSERDRFVTLAIELGIADRVHFLGRRTRAEVAQAMRNCTVFVLPSRFEGLGCVYLEAMACAKPAIGCEGQGIDEIIQDGVNGGLIPIEGLDQLVAKLQTLLADAELRLRMGQAARRTVLEKLTLSHQAENLTRIYREVGS